MRKDEWFVLLGGGMVALIVGGIAVAKWAPANIFRLDDSFGAIAACENNLTHNLVSPASYKRISARYIAAAPLDEAEHLEYDQTKGCSNSEAGLSACLRVASFFRAAMIKDRLEAKGVKRGTKALRERERTKYAAERYKSYQNSQLGKQDTAFVKIEYDASNSYGAAIREEHICRFGPKSGEKYTQSDIFTSLFEADDPYRY